MKRKAYVLDTNVILHDHKCIFQFDEHDIYLPIVVLEELDHFKKGNEEKNFNAREFARGLDLLANDALFTKGVSIGDGKGKLFVLTNSEYPDEIATSFMEKTADHRILAATMTLNKKNKQTILVTKDINLRIKALSFGIQAEDYINDKVTNFDVFHTNIETYENIKTAVVDSLYNEKVLDLSRLDMRKEFSENECFILKNHQASGLARFSTDQVRLVKKQECFGISPKNSEQTFAMDLLLDPAIQLIALTGKSGTGKTLLALAAALHQHGIYKNILLARPIVSLANKDLGFLPGDEKDKVAPYMQPFFDNLNVIKNKFSHQGKELRLIEEMQKSQQLVIEALAYIRGRSLSETFFIIDEAQNLTPHEIKTIITRAGEGTKIVFTGDIQQIDSPYLDMYSNGLVYAIDRMKGQSLFAHINLVKGERSYLSELAANLL